MVSNTAAIQGPCNLSPHCGLLRYSEEFCPLLLDNIGACPWRSGVWFIFSGVGFRDLVAPLAGFGLGRFWLNVFGKEGWVALRWLPVLSAFRRLALPDSVGVVDLGLDWAP